MFVVNERAGERGKEMRAGISGAKVPSPQAAGERGTGCNQNFPSPAYGGAESKAFGRLRKKAIS